MRIKKEQAAGIVLTTVATTVLFVFGLAFIATDIVDVDIVGLERLNIGATTSYEVKEVLVYPKWVPDGVKDIIARYIPYIKPPEWESGDESVILIDNDGTAHAVTGGIVELTATVDGKRYKKAVDVGYHIDEISTKQMLVVNAKGDRVDNPGVILYPEDAQVDCLTYRIEDTSIAVVDEQGNVTGLKDGKTTLYVEAPNGLVKEVPVVCTSVVEVIQGIVDGLERMVYEDFERAANKR